MTESPGPAIGWHLARITFEAATPLSCGSGVGIDADNAIARDANGLPIVPGSTLKGLLRREFDPARREAVFGADDARTAGRLIFSNAVVHSSADVAVLPGLLASDDDILRNLGRSAPMVRDHVRLDHRHGAHETGKFDRAAVPAGTRFSFEIMMWGPRDDARLLCEVASAMVSPWFRIGAGGRKGYGAITGVRLASGFYPPDRAMALRDKRQTPLSDHEALDPQPLVPSEPVVALQLKLSSDCFWRVGQDGLATSDATSQGRNGETRVVDLAPLREPAISWEHAPAVWVEPRADTHNGYVLPGSSLRGPLAHRTLYHWHVNAGLLIDCDAPVPSQDHETALKSALANRAQLEALFGKAADSDEGHVSSVFFEDVVLQVESTKTVEHVKIDRFTGGYFPGALYGEELVRTRPFACTIHVRPLAQQEIPTDAMAAFLAAICDLLEGRLAVGAKSQGVFKGELVIAGSAAARWQDCWDCMNRHGGAAHG